MSALTGFSPSSTYGDILQLGSNGQGLTSVPVRVQDGLGNNTNILLSTISVNFDRGQGQFQLDGVALTADANTLNNITDVATAPYLLQTSNPQLPNAFTFAVGSGLAIASGAGNFTISPAEELAGIQALNTFGMVVRTAPFTYTTRSLITDATLLLVNGDGTAGNPTLSVIDDTNVQRVNVSTNAVFQSQKPELNFIPGANVGITVNDNPGQNRTDIYISSAFTQALAFKQACLVGTTADLNATYVNGIDGMGAYLTNAGALAALTIDGVALSVGDRILVKDQVDQTQNGIYSVTAVGSGAAVWVITRTTDFDTAATISAGDFTIVTSGTTNINTSWIETLVVNLVGTDPIMFSPFGFSGTVTSVSGTANRITVTNPTSTPVIDIAATYVGQTSLTTLGTITTGVWNGTIVTVPFGGTGIGTTIAYGVICGGTTATGAFQNAGTGTINYILTSGGAGSLPAWQDPTVGPFQIGIAQLAHGFVVGNVIQCTGSNTYALAKADTAADADVVGIVVEVISSSVFKYQFGGKIIALAGLTAGTVYFLDPAVAGGYTPTAPTVAPQVSKPIFIAITTTAAIWINQRGQVL